MRPRGFLSLVPLSLVGDMLLRSHGLKLFQVALDSKVEYQVFSCLVKKENKYVWRGGGER